MKKLSMFLMALVAMTTINAKVVTFDFASADFLTSVGVTAPANDQDATNLTTMNYEGVTLTFTKVAKTDNRIWNSKGVLDLRMYNTSYVTISATENITGIEVVGSGVFFSELTNGTWMGDAANVTLTATATCKVTSFTVTYGQQAVVWKPDTLNVSEAIQLVKDKDPLKDKSHYVKGIVAEEPFLAGVYYCANLMDINNPNDTIQAFNFTKDANTKFTAIEEMQEQMSLGDTVLVYTNAIAPYNDIYELNGGYFSKMLGKTNVENLTSVYKYAFGAIAADAEVAPFPYEVVLSKESESKENALHFMIKTKEAKGIVGNYTIGDESYADKGQDKTPISGTLKISFKEKDGSYNKYDVVATFTMDGNVYRIDSTYAILGWYSDFSETFPLVDDVPFVPTEDQEITCAQAQEYALQVLAENAESPIRVSVIGYANNVMEPSGTEQSFYMDDVVNGKKIVQSYYGYLPAGKKVTNGAKIRLSGYMLHYVKNDNHTAEIKNGTIEILEGGEEMKREVVLEQIPDGALTVAEAKALTDKLSMKDAQHSDTSDVVVVKGYVTKLYNSFQNGNQSFYMDDDPATGDAYYDFEAFKCSLADYVVIGDEVFVEGRLVKYVGTSKSGSTYTNYNIVNCTGHFVALSTALREIAAKMPATQVKKVLYRGNLYIMRAGAIFDLNGNKMN